MARLTIADIRGLMARYKARRSPDRPLRCSFCGKPESEVQKLIAGPDVLICDECVGKCVEILNKSS